MKTNFAIFLLMLGIFLFAGCINTGVEKNTTTTSIVATTTEVTIHETTETTIISTTTIQTGDCNKICADEGYSKTLGAMSAVDCDKNTPENSSKKWKFNCCCYNSNTDCYDSDDGQNFYVKGTVTYGENPAFMDYCEGDNLFEYFCTNGIPDGTKINCEFGCKDGACVKQ